MDTSGKVHIQAVLKRRYPDTMGPQKNKQARSVYNSILTKIRVLEKRHIVTGYNHELI